MKVPFLDLRSQYQQIKESVLPVVTQAMTDAAFIGGPQVEGLETEFAEFCGTKYCIGVNSGTDALRFALIAAGVGEGHEVITVPNTFIATTEAISQTGAKPCFVDVDPYTCNIDVRQIEAKISEKTKAILPVHLYGQPANMDAIMNLAEKHNLVVIEDACQSHGAVYNNEKAGAIGKVGCFSFYPGKNLGAFGDGGAAVTNDEQLALKMKMLRDHGQSEKYFHELEGYNGRLDAIQAAVLRIKLRHLENWNESRRSNAMHYSERLADVKNVMLPVDAENVQSVYHLYVIRVKDRDDLQKYLSEKGVATGLHYPLPLHLQVAYKYLGYQKGDFPVAEKAAEELLSLPMYPELEKHQIDYVCEAIRAFYNKA